MQGFNEWRLFANNKKLLKSRISLRLGRQPTRGVPKYDFAKFTQNCMKLKEFGPPKIRHWSCVAGGNN